jgi:hypothetical protein
MTVRGNDDFGAWVQNSPGRQGSPAIQVDGQSIFSANRGVGVYLQNVGDARFEEVTIEDTGVLPRIVDGLSSVEIGDGIQASSLVGTVALQGVVLRGNPRVGLLIDGSQGSLTAVSLDNVSVEFGGLPTPAEGEEIFSVVLQGVSDEIVGEDGLVVDEGFSPPSAEIFLELTDPLEAIPGIGGGIGAGIVGEDGKINEDVRVGPAGIVGEDG